MQFKMLATNPWHSSLLIPGLSFQFFYFVIFFFSERFTGKPTYFQVCTFLSVTNRNVDKWFFFPSCLRKGLKHSPQGIPLFFHVGSSNLRDLTFLLPNIYNSNPYFLVRVHSIRLCFLSFFSIFNLYCHSAVIGKKSLLTSLLSKTSFLRLP